MGVIALGFATLMVRLEVTQEGYRISTLRSDNLKLEEDNRNLRLGAAEVASRERLRALAPKYQPWSARARAGGDGAVNQPFKKRRGRIGALTIVLAALFVLIALGSPRWWCSTGRA